MAPMSSAPQSEGAQASDTALPSPHKEAILAANRLPALVLTPSSRSSTPGKPCLNFSSVLQSISIDGGRPRTPAGIGSLNDQLQRTETWVLNCSAPLLSPGLSFPKCSVKRRGQGEL